jgi:phospholipase C
VGAVFHVYDRLHLERAPRRYTVGAGRQLRGLWTSDAYDLWVLGPNGFHRHFAGAASTGNAPRPEIELGYDTVRGNIALRVTNDSASACNFQLRANAYFDATPLNLAVPARGQASHYISLRGSSQWYDFSVTVPEQPSFYRRFAGRVETGRDTLSDPALGGPALGTQLMLPRS